MGIRLINLIFDTFELKQFPTTGKRVEEEKNTSVRNN